MSDSPIVQLRTGIEAHGALVAVLTLAIRRALRDEPLTLVDAVEMAHTGQPQAYSADRLEALGFTQQGRMHESTRDVILAATKGRDLNIVLVDPVAGGAR